MSKSTAGTVITFYSWKGGVGRTMALANIGVQLARAGSSVLMVDWDLEAPGLDRYFLSADAQDNAKVTALPAADPTGLMGLLNEASQRKAGTVKVDEWRKKLVKLGVRPADATSGAPIAPNPGRLDLLPSGYEGGEYAPQLSAFSWSHFFIDARGGEWLEELRDQWSAAYEYILIDSRTGLTDSGGVCTIQMPHMLVLVFTANDQSLDGGLRVVAAAQKERRDFSYDRGPLAVIPLLSRWEGEKEVDIAEQWMQRFDTQLVPLTASWLPKEFSPRQILEKTRIPHVARFSFGEPLPVLTHSLTDPGLPSLYFDAIARLIRSQLGDAGKIIDPYYRAPSDAIFKPIVLPYPSLGPLFKGRDGFMQQLHESLSRGKGKTAITSKALYGLGGIGKTRAAVEYAWAHLNDYTALLFVVAESPEALRRNIAALAATLIPSLDAADDTVRMQAVLQWLEANSGWLLILDNLDTKQALAEAEGLIAKLSGGHLVITSRLVDFSANFEPLPLDVLTIDDAAAFLLDRTKNRRRSAPDDDAKVRGIAIELDGLALALEQAAAYIAKQGVTFRTYLNRWRSGHDTVLNWFDKSTATGYPRAVAITWQTSVEQLSKTGRHMLERLAWLAPEKVPEFLLEVPVPGAETENLHDALAELTAYSLAARDGEGPYFLIHRLVQDVTRRSLADEPRQQRLREALGWINNAFPHDAHNIASWPRAEAVEPHARVVAFNADNAAISAPTVRLMYELGSFLHSKSLYSDAEPFYQRALAISEKVLGPDNTQIGDALNNLAELYLSQSRYAEAEPLFQRSLAIFEKARGQDHPSVAVSLNNLALLYESEGRYAEAETLYQRSLTIIEKSYGPDQPLKGVLINRLAELYRAQGRYAEAEPLYHRALDILEKALGSDNPSVGASLNSLAGLYREQGRYSEAEPLYQRSLAISEKAFGPNHAQVGIVLNNLAVLYRAQAKYSMAEPLHQRALAILNKR